MTESGQLSFIDQCTIVQSWDLAIGRTKICVSVDGFAFWANRRIFVEALCLFSLLFREW